MRQVDKILVCRGSGRDWAAFEEELEDLRKAAEACRGEEVLERLRAILRTMKRRLSSAMWVMFKRVMLCKPRAAAPPTLGGTGSVEHGRGSVLHCARRPPSAYVK